MEFCSGDLSALQGYAAELLPHIEMYSWLWEFHAVDFFLSDYWGNFSFTGAQEWKDSLLKSSTVNGILDENDLLERLLKLATFGEVDESWPESLKVMIKTSRSIALNRDSDKIPLVKSLQKDAKTLDNKYTRGMSEKKKHEVALLSQLIHQTATTHNIKHILDLGAGQGYLDNILAFQYAPNDNEGYVTVGADDSDIQTCGAKKRVMVAEKSAKRDASKGRIVHVNRRILPDEDLDLVLKEGLGSGFDGDLEVNERKSWLLCGLHTCGDLSPTIIRHFLANESVKAMVFVGCCYNHLSEDNGLDSTDRTSGFPMSRFVKGYYESKPNLRTPYLGFAARTLACQATCRWYIDRESSIENFNKHFARAVLQVIMFRIIEQARIEKKKQTTNCKCLVTDTELDCEVDVSLRTRLTEVLSGYEKTSEIVVGRIRTNVLEDSFLAYARKALDRIFQSSLKDTKNKNLSRMVISDDGINMIYTEYVNRRSEIAILWTLRACMAECVESLIFIDRLICIHENSSDENSLKVSGFPIFNQVNSPRNLVIVASKYKQVFKEK